MDQKNRHPKAPSKNYNKHIQTPRSNSNSYSGSNSYSYSDPNSNNPGSISNHLGSSFNQHLGYNSNNYNPGSISNTVDSPTANSNNSGDNFDYNSNNMSFRIYSPQPSGSPHGGGSPFLPGHSPINRKRPSIHDNLTTTTPSGLNFLLPSASNALRSPHGSIEQNISYTRGYSGERFSLNDSPLGLTPGKSLPNSPYQHQEQSHSDLLNHHQQQQQQSQDHHLQQQQQDSSDEDDRFLRLAREALVATAKGVKRQGGEIGADDLLMIDPTIQDLLRRLQYAASPHGNPIKKSDGIKANQKGQLMIQSFYEQFPNLSNDIFTNNQHLSLNSNERARTPPSEVHPSNRENSGWNFLIGEPIQFKNDPIHKKDTAPEPSELKVKPGGFSKKAKHDRKFLCDKCSMSFRRSSDLKRHEKQHLSIPPNICDLCGKGFARKDALKRHMGTLTCKRNADKKLYVDNLQYLTKDSDDDDNLASYK